MVIGRGWGSSKVWGVVASLALCVCVARCTEEGSEEPDGEQDYYKDDELGFDVDGMDWSAADPVDSDGDGDPEYAEDGDVEWGGEKHDVNVVNEVDTDSSNGGRASLTVTDTVNGNTRRYSYDPAAATFTFSDDTGALAVVKNPDNSYSVNGQAAANGKAAVAIMKQSPVYQDASAWGFIMTYSVCQSCLEIASTRAPTNCNFNMQNVAEAPAVCDVFRDLCDCAICDKLGKMPCSKCP